MYPSRDVKQIFQSALDCELQERPTFLASACGGDAALQQRVESLLSLDREHEDFLKSPVFELSAADVATRVLEEDEEPSLLAQHIGPYRIIREIGRGGMGAVYLAARDDGQYDQQVAIKLIKRGMDSEEVLRRFRRERQILANLSHPNISRLLDGGMTLDGRPYFVMEYVAGMPIDEYADQQQLSIDERLKLFRRVCAAVQHAHERKIIHRDLKPCNVLITADGTVKLLDFGIAKLLDAEQSSKTIDQTDTARRVLTPEYASPEQLRGSPLTDVSDVYSLGILLYKFLTGHRPYAVQSRNSDEILKVLIETDPDKPSVAIERRSRTLDG